MKKQGKKWMLVVLALLAVVTVALPLVGCKNDSVSEQTGDGTGSGSGNQGSGDPEQPVTYTVYFYTNGGGFIDSQTIVSGQTATKPADPTLENNVFGGWYSDEELTSEYDFTTTVTGSFTLYAKWVKRIEVNAYDVYNSVIPGLTGDGAYILVATGKWSSDDLSRLANELKDESKKVNLDLSKVSDLTEIGVTAFQGCSGLTSISIPEGVKSIDGSAFSGCSGLTSIDLSKATGLTRIGEAAFSGCSGLTSIDIPERVTTIGAGAFRGCRGLTSISIPEGVEIIGGDAFYECRGLTSISIPSSVTSIGNHAFDGCRDLTSISIPSSVEIIREAAFQGCSELTTVTMKATTPPELGYGVFEDVSKILVPSGFVKDYWEAENWKEYSGIIEAIPDQTS